jgi:hypothetical protein
MTVSRLYNLDDRMINEYGAVDGMRIGRGNRSTRRKLAPVPHCPPQTLGDLRRNGKLFENVNYNSTEQLPS